MYRDFSPSAHPGQSNTSPVKLGRRLGTKFASQQTVYRHLLSADLTTGRYYLGILYAYAEHNEGLYGKTQSARSFTARSDHVQNFRYVTQCRWVSHYQRFEGT